MPAPLALIGGSILRAGAGAAARTAVAGGTRAAVGQAAKGAIKKSIKDKAIGAVKNKLLGSKKEKVSKEKLLGKPKTGLVKYSGGSGDNGGPSSIIKRPGFGLVSQNNIKNSDTLEEQKTSFDSILKVLDDIRSSLKNIESLINTEIKSISDRIKNQSIFNFKKRAEDKESRLEKKKDQTEDEDKEGEDKKEPPSLFDRIWNYFSNILLGSLLNWGLNYLPQITEAFNSVIDAFQNPLKRLKFAIITLTTVFPRFTRRVLSFGRKIFTGPARLIGNLIIRAAKLVTTLFRKAGGAIFNLIKEPIKKLLGPAASNALKGIGQGISSLFRRGSGRTATRTAAAIGGKGAAKAVSGTTSTIARTAPAVFKRLKTFSKVLKRVPIIGALIGIGIDLAMGEPLDRAIVGAAGASLGAALGALIGQGVIPIPVFGAAVGGFVGSAIGDWAAKSFYEYLKGKTAEAESEVKVESKSSGGTVNKETKTTRETSVTKRQFTERRIQRIPSYSKSPPLDQNLVNQSKSRVLSGENSSKRFIRLSNAFRSIPLIGEVLNLGISIGLGKKINGNDARTAANQIANSIGTSIRDKKIRGINPNLAESISVALSQWARTKILDEIRKKQGELNIRESDKDSARVGGGGMGGRRGGGRSPGSIQPAPSISGGTSDFWTLVAVASREDGDPQGRADVAQSIYNRLIASGYGGRTISQLILGRMQYEPTWRYPRGATKGRGNPNPEWLNIKDAASAAAASGLSESEMRTVASTLLNSTLQKNAREYIQGRTDFRGYPVSGGIQRKSGDNYFGWYGNYRENKIANVPNFNATSSSPTNAPPAPTLPPPAGGGMGGRRGSGANPSNPSGRKQRKKIYLHWTAGGHQSVVGPYHTIITGDGKIHRRVPYDRHSDHTYRRNTNAIGIAIAAMGGKDPWSTPPTNAQLNAMATEVANVAKSWGWSPNDINLQNVMTHAEAASNKDGVKAHDNYGPRIWGGTGERWDLLHLKKNDAPGTGGNIIRGMISSRMGGSGSNNDLNPQQELSDSPTSPDGSSPSSTEESTTPELPMFQKEKMWTILGDPSNPRNKGFLPLSTSSTETKTGDKHTHGKKGPGKGGSLTGIPRRNGTKSMSSNGLNISNTLVKPNFTEHNYNYNTSNIISPVSNINVTPLNVKASYESPQSTIIMIPLPPKNNNPQPQIPIGGGERILPIFMNSSSSFYKQVLTRALY